MLQILQQISCKKMKKEEEPQMRRDRKDTLHFEKWSSLNSGIWRCSSGAKSTKRYKEATTTNARRVITFGGGRSVKIETGQLRGSISLPRCWVQYKVSIINYQARHFTVCGFLYLCFILFYNKRVKIVGQFFRGWTAGSLSYASSQLTYPRHCSSSYGRSSLSTQTLGEPFEERSKWQGRIEREARPTRIPLNWGVTPVSFLLLCLKWIKSLQNILSQIASWQMTDPKTYLPEGFHDILHQINAESKLLTFLSRILLGLTLPAHC